MPVIPLVTSGIGIVTLAHAGSAVFYNFGVRVRAEGVVAHLCRDDFCHRGSLHRPLAWRYLAGSGTPSGGNGRVGVSRLAPPCRSS